MKPKQCRQCKAPFSPKIIGQKVCSTKCAMDYARSNPQIMERVAKSAEKAQKAVLRKAKREAKDKLKTRSEWLAEAQKKVNEYIRMRDKGKNCIACDKPITGIGHASHYRTVASSPHLRFDERNIHLGCQKCNIFLVGNIINYRTNLVKRIGIDVVEQLESDQSTKKWSIEDIKAIKEKYSELVKRQSICAMIGNE